MRIGFMALLGAVLIVTAALGGGCGANPASGFGDSGLVMPGDAGATRDDSPFG